MENAREVQGKKNKSQTLRMNDLIEEIDHLIKNSPDDHQNIDDSVREFGELEKIYQVDYNVDQYVSHRFKKHEPRAPNPPEQGRQAEDEEAEEDPEEQLNEFKNQFNDNEEWVDNAAGEKELDFKELKRNSNIVDKYYAKDKPKKAAKKPDEDLEDIKREITAKMNEKCEELQSEIRNYKLKSEKLRVERSKFEDQRRQLEREREKFAAEKEEQLRQFEEYKAEEVKKLRREKQIAQRNLQAMAQKPNKKERDEIEILKEQLKKQEEDAAAKEKKLKLNLERFKKKIDELTEENQELKEQVLHLEKLRLNVPAEPKPALRHQKSVEQIAPKQKPEPGRNKSPIRQNVVDRDASVDRSPSVDEKAKGRRQSVSKSKLAPQKPAIPKFNSKKEEEPELEQKSAKTAASRKRAPSPEGKPVLAKEPPNVFKNIYATFKNPFPEHNGFRFRDVKMDKFRHENNKFYRQYVEKSQQARRAVQRDVLANGNTQIVYDNGVTEVVFLNGSRRETFPNKYSIVHFPNGDVKQVLPDSSVVYYYAEHDSCQITYPQQGLNIYTFGTAQIEYHYADKVKHIKFANGAERQIYENDGEEFIIFENGSVQGTNKEGVKLLSMPDGRKELTFANGKKIKMDAGGEIEVEDNEDDA